MMLSPPLLKLVAAMAWKPVECLVDDDWLLSDDDSDSFKDSGDDGSPSTLWFKLRSLIADDEFATGMKGTVRRSIPGPFCSWWSPQWKALFSIGLWTCTGNKIGPTANGNGAMVYPFMLGFSAWGTWLCCRTFGTLLSWWFFTSSIGKPPGT